MKVSLFILCAILISTSISYSQSIGEIRTKSSGNWNHAIWEKYNGTSWVSMTLAELNDGDTTRKITIVSGHTVSLNGATPSLYDLTVQEGATIDYTITSNIYLYHNLICNGVLGNAASTNIALHISGSNCSISGDGEINCTRIRKNITSYISILNINCNINSRFSGTSIYNNISGSIFTVNINTGAALNIMGTAANSPGDISLAGYGNASGTTVKLNV